MTEEEPAALNLIDELLQSVIDDETPPAFTTETDGTEHIDFYA